MRFLVYPRIMPLAVYITATTATTPTFATSVTTATMLLYIATSATTYYTTASMKGTEVLTLSAVHLQCGRCVDADDVHAIPYALYRTHARYC